MTKCINTFAVHSTTTLSREMIAEYGFDTSTTEGRLTFEAYTVPPKVSRGDMTIGKYVRCVRRLTGHGCDGRVIAVGFNTVTPHEMATMLRAWLAYWDAGQRRPGTVGSAFNVTPAWAFFCFLHGMPLWVSKVKEMRVPRFRVVRTASGPRAVLPRRTATRLWRTIRASARRSAQHACIPLGKDVLRFCGRLSAWEQALLLAMAARTYHDNGWRGHGVLRVRDLPLTEWKEGLRDNKVAVEMATALVAGDCHPLYPGIHAGTLARAWAPGYPHVGESAAAKLCTGVTPVQLSGGELTRAEAHEWLSTFAAPIEGGGLTHPLGYLMQKYADELPDFSFRSVAQLRWVLAVRRRGAWEEVTRERVERHPHEGEYRYRILDHLDEIQDEDLVEGPRTSVRRAFERAAQRRSAEAMAQMARMHQPVAPAPEAYISGLFARWLLSPAELEQEGREMRHCVAGYVTSVAKQQVAILAINVFGARSTVEVRLSDLAILQHRSVGNADAPLACQRVLSLMEREWEAERLRQLAL